MKHARLSLTALPLLVLNACELDDGSEDTSNGADYYESGDYYTQPSYQPYTPPNVYNPTPPAPASTPAPCTHTPDRSFSMPESAAPFDLVSLGHVGFCAEDRVIVRVMAGNQIRDIAAVSAAPLQFVAPLWLDDVTGQFGSADVTVTFISPRGVWRVNDTLQLRELDVDADAPNLGDATLAMLDGSRYAVLDSRSTLSVLAGSDNILDPSLSDSLQGLDLLESAILDVQYFGTSSLSAPLIDGRAISLDRQSLAVLDALSRAYFEGADTGLDGPLPKAQNDAFDEGWFDDMAYQTATGSLQMARRFTGMIGNHLGFLGLAAALTSTTPALAIVGGVAFATMIVAPAASALAINVGTRWMTGAINNDTWGAFQPSFQYAMDAGLEFVRAEVATALFRPSEVGGAIARVINDNLNPMSGVVETFTDLLWDDSSPAADTGTEVDGATYDDYTDDTNLTPPSEEMTEGEEEEDEEDGPARGSGGALPAI